MDERAFEQRVLELEPRLYRTACAILWNDADAADALQECLLKAWRKRGSLKEEACFNSWITRILINECHTLRYRLRRHKTVSFDEAVGDVPAGAPVDLGLRDALRAVPPKAALSASKVCAIILLIVRIINASVLMVMDFSTAL